MKKCFKKTIVAILTTAMVMSAGVPVFEGDGKVQSIEFIPGTATLNNGSHVSKGLVQTQKLELTSPNGQVGQFAWGTKIKDTSQLKDATVDGKWILRIYGKNVTSPSTPGLIFGNIFYKYSTLKITYTH